MIKLKSKEQIEIMKEGGKILSDTLKEVLNHAKPGVTEGELDKLAEELIIKKGGEPGFKRVQGYCYTTCMSTNDVVVHGIPTGKVLKEGDVLGIDCGVYYKGFNTDMSETIRIRSLESKTLNKEDEVDIFINIGKKALEEAIKVAKIGNRVGHISKTIQDIVEGSGYAVVRSLVGHGVGKELHEKPEIPGFLVTDINKTSMLKEGMTIAIEVIYNMGKSDVVYSEDDSWTIITKDHSLSGLFERTVAITKNGPLVLTK